MQTFGVSREIAVGETGSAPQCHELFPGRIRKGSQNTKSAGVDYEGFGEHTLSYRTCRAWPFI